MPSNATVTSLHNDRLRWLRRVAGDRRLRRREGIWLAEGRRLAEEVVRENLPVRLWVVEDAAEPGDSAAPFLERAAARGEPVLRLARGLLREVCDTQTPQGLAVVFQAPRWTPEQVLEGAGPLVLLDRVQDPGNLGTIARVVEASGGAGLLLTAGTADPGNPKALRASAGSLLRLPVARAERPVALLREHRIPVLATTGRGGRNYRSVDLSGRFALVLGQEGSGVSARLAAAADAAVTVPMAGRVESLNVAATAAVLLFEAARQRDPAALP